MECSPQFVGIDSCCEQFPCVHESGKDQIVFLWYVAQLAAVSGLYHYSFFVEFVLFSHERELVIQMDLVEYRFVFKVSRSSNVCIEKMDLIHQIPPADQQKSGNS